MPGAPPATLRLSLCDDDENFRALVREVLRAEDDMEVVSESADGRECVEKVAAEQPDAVLLDLVMPAMLGFDAIPELCAVAPRTKVIVLSSQVAPGVQDEVRRLGAAGFIDKGAGQLVDSLAADVRAVLRGA